MRAERSLFEGVEGDRMGAPRARPAAQLSRPAHRVLIEVVAPVDRLLRFMHRANRGALCACRSGWCELLSCILPVSMGRELNLRRYNRQSRQYVRFTELFDWELKAFERHFPRSVGRMLIGAAGAGREAVELVRRGHDVVCFDPAAEMVAGMKERFSGLLSSTEPLEEAGSVRAIECCSYEELTGAVGSEVLQRIRSAAPFDGCVLGWGSLSLILSARERIETIRLFRSLCPAGPLLLSWMGPVPPGRVRRAVARLTGHESRFRYVWGLGFHEPLGRADVERLAADAGEEILMLNDEHQGYAVFGPAKSAHDR